MGQYATAMRRRPRRGQAMSNQQDELSECEQPLGEIVFAWLQASDSGQSVDREELLVHHPEFAGALTEFFAQEEHFQRLAAPLREAVRYEPESSLDETAGLEAPRMASPTMAGGSFAHYELLRA